MINFDAVDFSERRSEEVMFLLTLSVLKLLQYYYSLKKKNKETNIQYKQTQNTSMINMSMINMLL